MSPKKYNFVHSMKGWELFRLMVAVALLFGIHGPVFLLADSVLDPGSVGLLLVRTLLVASFSAFIVLAIRFPWLGIPLVAVGMIAMISSEQIASYITGKDERIVESISYPMELTPAEFNSIKRKRLSLYAVTALLVGSSWGLMASVLNSEGKKRGRLEAEINIARDIQRSLLPAQSFSNEWCTISGLAIPAAEVGGDYFDVVGISADLVAVIIADVSGHGVGAGIVSAMTKSAFHSQLLKDASPREVLANLNTTLFQVTEDKTFVTCAYVLLQRPNLACIATAGHLPVLRRSGANGTVTEIRTPNLPLGVKSGISFQDKVVRFSEGDLFFLYTDGITEASAKAGEQFGLERVKQLVERNSYLEKIAEESIKEVRAFTRMEGLSDDATVVSIFITDPSHQHHRNKQA